MSNNIQRKKIAAGKTGDKEVFQGFDDDNIYYKTRKGGLVQLVDLETAQGLVGANNELSEVLANGSTTGGTDISVTPGDVIDFGTGMTVTRNLLSAGISGITYNATQGVGFAASTTEYISYDGTDFYISKTGGYPDLVLFNGTALNGARLVVSGNASSQVYTFPDATGTVALTSDITVDLPATTGVVKPGASGTPGLGNANTPYATVTAAVSAGAEVVIMLAGTYTETITLASNTTYYAEPGVKFTAGGLREPGSGTLSNCKWLGYAAFEGNFECIYFVNFIQFTDVLIEFDYIKTTGTTGRDLYLWLNTTLKSTVNINCNKIDSFGGNGNSIGMIGNIDGTINIRDRHIADYNPYSFGFTGAFPAPSDFTINCPLTIMRDGGWTGNSTGKMAAYVLNSDANMNIEINGRLETETGAGFTSVASVITTWSSGGGGKIVWNGDKIVPSMPRGLYSTRTGTSVISRGDLVVANGKLLEVSAGNVSVEDAKCETDEASALSGTATTYLKNVHIYNTGANVDFFDLTSATHDFYCDNVIAEGDGGTGEFIDTGGIAYSSGLKDTWSTQANDGLFTNLYAAGFTTETAVIANKVY
jgi:hypothetical protein